MSLIFISNQNLLLKFKLKSESFYMGYYFHILKKIFRFSSYLVFMFDSVKIYFNYKSLLVHKSINMNFVQELLFLLYFAYVFVFLTYTHHVETTKNAARSLHYTRPLHLTNIFISNRKTFHIVIGHMVTSNILCYA